MRTGARVPARHDAGGAPADAMKFSAALPGRLKRLAGTAAEPRPLGAQLAALVGAALVAAQAALLVWNLVPGARRPAPALPQAPHAAAVDLSQIIDARPFGALSAAGGGADAPRTNAALVLAGTLAVSDPTQGLAIIGETAQAGKVYSVGAMLPGGVKLREVYTDRVVLDRGGTLETLPLPRQLGAGRPLSPVGNGAEPALADSVQKLIAKGPEVIGEIIRPMPAYANGQLKGFTLYPGRQRAKFQHLGLQQGDLVTAINNVPLTDAQRGMEILRGLGNGGSAQVTIERAGATQTLSIDAAQVADLAEPQGAPGQPAGAAPVPAPATPEPQLPPN
jgi:general secretion pathway protein C